MKKLILLFFISSFLSYGNDKKAKSTIKKVTVYLQGAQVTRDAYIHLLPGSNKYNLSNLSPFIDENSIQVSGLKSASVVSLNYKVDYLKKEEDTEEIIVLSEKQKLLLKQISLLRNKIKGLEEEELLLTTNRKLNVENTSTDLAKIKEFALYYGNRITVLRNDIYDALQEVNNLNRENNKVSLRLKNLSDHTGPERGEIVLKLESDLPLSLSLKVSYTVSNADWFPVYDIKAKDIQSPLSFYYKAHVYQQTGIDWDNAQITLSTNDPSIDSDKPEVTPYYLNFVNSYAYKNSAPKKKSRYKYNPLIKRVNGTVVDQSGLPLPGVNVVIKGTTIGTQTDFDGNYSLDISEGQELVFSYIGQKAEEVPVYASLINMRLQEDASSLEEVVVTAYGTSAIQGRSADVLIRGNSSIKSTQSTLYIVDGVPQDDISSIDQSEIKNIETLKGSSATAIYGSRGANGVVIVTTRTSAATENITSKEFKIKKTYSIPSINDITAIHIDDFIIDASYEYFAAPILNENVFLTAKLASWEQFDLLPGEANIYFVGSYAGKTFIDPFKTEKNLTISLGVEPLKENKLII